MIARKGSKDVQIEWDGDRQRISFAVFFNAEGTYTPPFIILRGSNTPQGRAAKAAMFSCWKDATFALTENATQTEETFGTCVSWWAAHSLVPPDSLLLVDGHSSRVSPDAILACRTAGHGIYTLPPHTSHATQAFDAGIAKPLTRAIQVAVNKMKLGDTTTKPPVKGVAVTSKNFLLAVRAGFSAAFSSRFDPVLKKDTNIGEASFRKVGIHPFNPAAISSDRFKPSEYLKKEVTDKRPQVSSPEKLAVASKHTAQLLESAEIDRLLTEKVKKKRQSAVPGMTLLTGAEYLSSVLAEDAKKEAAVKEAVEKREKKAEAKAAAVAAKTEAAAARAAKAAAKSAAVAAASKKKRKRSVAASSGAVDDDDPRAAAKAAAKKRRGGDSSH